MTVGTAVEIEVVPMSAPGGVLADVEGTGGGQAADDQVLPNGLPAPPPGGGTGWMIALAVGLVGLLGALIAHHIRARP